jgi:hypothetical protein
LSRVNSVDRRAAVPVPKDSLWPVEASTELVDNLFVLPIQS